MPESKQRETPRRGVLPFRLIVVLTLSTSVCAGGCSTVTPPAQTSVLTPGPSAPVTVRAQDGDLASGDLTSESPRAVPPPRGGAPNDDAEPGGANPPSLSPPALDSTMGPLETVFESLFGEASSSEWTPLSINTLFTQGWNQRFVFSPASDSGALRQEWIDAANGVFYRQWVLDYNFRDHVTPSGNQDIGTWSLFAPLSRRLELYLSVPFVDYRRVDPPPGPNPPRGIGNRSNVSSLGSPYTTTFGDISITPQVMLHETKNTSIMSILTIETPTGSTNVGNGETSLSPQIQFWQGLPRRWVIRGGAGPTIPLSPAGLHTTLDTNLTIGRFLTLDEPRYFKELSVWLAVNNTAATDWHGPGGDILTILPGMRFRFAPGAWFLYGVEIPLVMPKDENFGMYFSIVRRY